MDWSLPGGGVLLKIGELARRAGLTVRTLHHYDAIGLLVPSGRSTAGYRLYDRRDIVRLYRIQALQRVGLSLAEIARVLKDDGAPLAEIIDHQIEALDQQIAQATALRRRLDYTRERLQIGGQPTLDAWLRILELMSASEKYFSSDELKRLRDGMKTIAGQWPPLIAELRSVHAQGVPPHDPAVRDLALRWLDLVRRMVDADPVMVAKWHRMHLREPALQAQAGIDEDLLQYFARAASHVKVALFAPHLNEEEVARLRPDGPRQAEWPLLVAEVLHHVEIGTPDGSPEAQALLEQWEALQRELAGGDPMLQRRLEEVLQADAELAERLAMTAGISLFLQRARVARSDVLSAGDVEHQEGPA